ncbi:MAG: lytic transglycosylase domain-containing protein [Methylotenera sp.]|nr:lytic transglycosylase domain-containing protein [Oligoflexia bacterium]
MKLGFKVVVGLTLLVVGEMSGVTATAGHMDRNPRLAHARELMGKYYRKSVVKKAEHFSTVESFVKNTTRSSLQGKFRKMSPQVATALLQEASRYSFDPIFLMAVIAHESGFNPLAIGTSGEIGLMQIKPDTAEWIADKYDLKYDSAETLKNPVENIKIGAAYMSFLRERFDSHSRLYLAAYNMGAKNVDRALDRNVWPRDYPSAVMNHYIRFYTELNKMPQIVAPSRKKSMMISALVLLIPSLATQ